MKGTWLWVRESGVVAAASVELGSDALSEAAVAACHLLRASLTFEQRCQLFHSLNVMRSIQRTLALRAGEHAPLVSLPVTLQCSGNRLAEADRAIGGVNGWTGRTSGIGLVSTAAFEGVRLAEGVTPFAHLLSPVPVHHPVLLDAPVRHPLRATPVD